MDKTRRGVLLINLGTPSRPTPSAVRAYLAEFLMDPRVVELPVWLWKPLLYGLILPIRAPRSAKLYQSIWTTSGSPLAVYSKRLTAQVQQQLGPSFTVVLAMRYGQPSIREALEGFCADPSMGELTVLPLYPQYAAATTASCWDAVVKSLGQRRFIKTLRLSFISGYHENKLYIDLLTKAVQQYWHTHGRKSFLLFSFHGLPQRCVQLGDPYEQQCYATVKCVVNQLQLSTGQYQLVFQSRFGRAKWLQPYCESVLQQLPKRGQRQVVILCPGFAVDCLETLEEIAKRYRELFFAAGGETFHYIPALNDSVGHAQLLAKLIQSTQFN